MSTLTPFRQLFRAPASSLLTRSFSTSPARSLARLTLVGRLAAEPELSVTSTGHELVKYAVGTSYGPKDNRQTSWFRVTSFLPEGPIREHLLGLPKGTLLLVEADASVRVYDDSDGKKTSSLNLVQRSFDVLKRPNPPSDESTPSEGSM